MLPNCHRNINEYRLKFLSNNRKIFKNFSNATNIVVTAEKNFSTLPRVKSWMHSRMNQDRLEGLALVHIHADIDIEIERVIDRFAKESKRLQFVL